MKTQKLLIVLASAGLAFGVAGCSSTDKKAEDTPKPPSVSQVEKQKQKAEKEAKAKAEKEAKAKAEQEAKAEAEAKAKAEQEAQAQAAAKAKAPAPVKAQPKARSYQPKARSYQRKAQPKRHYQAPRRSGTKAKSGNSGEWKVGESKDYGGARWTRTSENEVHSKFCFDSEGKTWPC
ncbi:hypothetical protein CYK25_008940 [Varibaculum cambriense]|nr:hypothetical protein CYK25_008940 [Varibaculum cambriense]